MCWRDILYLWVGACTGVSVSRTVYVYDSMLSGFIIDAIGLLVSLLLVRSALRKMAVN